MTMSPAARALLDAAREGLSPTPEALHRVRGKALASATSGAGAALAIKLAIVSVVAIAAGALALRASDDRAATPTLAFATSAQVEAHASREQRAYEAPPPVAHIEMPAQRLEMPAQRLAPATSVGNVPGPDTAVGNVPGPDTAVGNVPVPGHARTATVEPSAAPMSGVEQAAPRRGIDLAREVELVDAAMAALRKGDATAALASVRMHRAETANRGQLAEDAAAIEIEALCRLHDRRVAAKLEAFDARWPESAQRSRLSTSCP